MTWRRSRLPLLALLSALAGCGDTSAPRAEVDGGRVTVRFHLTSPLCPAKFAGAIGQEIRRRVARLPGVEAVEVVLTDHFMADALHRLINEGDRFAETRGVMRR